VTNASLSRMVRGLSVSILIAAMWFGASPLGGEARGVAPETNSTASDDTGRYFALVIGIDKYPSPVPELRTAVKDAKEIADILQEKYGFNTTLLIDANATRAGILDQIAAYETQLGENDNLLIYYAGHGFQLKQADKSFWLPVDATSNQSSNRISADDLTTEMAMLKARHVLVVSDSCYSGGLTRDINSLPVIGPDDAFLRKKLFLRSRTLMASGGDEPVADGGPNGHSVFAWALLQALNGETESLFTASTLFYDRVQRAVAGNSEQIPVYQPIRNSGDTGGDFVFRRVKATEAETQSRLVAAATGYDRGFAYYRVRDFARAAPIFADGCSQGDPRSCTGLGYLYETGYGVAQDYSQAVSLDRKACEGGDAHGCSNLGLLYEHGRGVAQDYGQAASLYGKACDRGDISGCNNLGLLYENGRGVAQDYSQAVSLLGRACDGDDASSCANLGWLYLAGQGVAQDFNRALSLYRKACDGGIAQGCNVVGISYASGQGVAQDYGQAVSLFRKACDGNDAGGCANLGSSYETGRGVAQDYGQAVSLYRKACDGGAVHGCGNLGALYQNGQGVAKDYGQADILFEKACNASDSGGCRFLGMNLEMGLGRGKSLTDALTYYQKACQLGAADSCKDVQRLKASEASR
jgi:uncharacterized protein